jgi:hypothetical protein
MRDQSLKRTLRHGFASGGVVFFLLLSVAVYLALSEAKKPLYLTLLFTAFLIPFWAMTLVATLYTRWNNLPDPEDGTPIGSRIAVGSMAFAFFVAVVGEVLLNVFPPRHFTAEQISRPLSVVPAPDVVRQFVPDSTAKPAE